MGFLLVANVYSSLESDTQFAYMHVQYNPGNMEKFLLSAVWEISIARQYD